MKVPWDVETGGGGLYPAGVYKVSPKEITECEAKSGNPQLKIVTNIIEGDLKGRKLTDYITLVDSCAWKLVKFIKAMGVDVSQLESMDTGSGKFRAVINKCLNKSTYWKVDIIQGFTGQDRNDVSDYIKDEEQVEETVDEPEFLKDSDKPGEQW
jgi:hypothetical protein